MPCKHVFRNRSAQAVVLSLVWLLVGVGCGIFIDRHLPDGADSAQGSPDFGAMGEAWRLIDQHYVDRAAIRPQRMTYAAISGMVDSLGDTGHSVFLTPQEVRESREAMEGHFPGIGAEVRMLQEQVVVVAPMDGTPAQKAGLRPGDIILKVDGKPTVGHTLMQTVRRIRGPAGTKVTLLLESPHSKRTRSVTLVRAVIQVPSVSWHMLPGSRVADVRIASFSEGTAAALGKALAGLKAHGARAMILDLRDDPGGLLDQAVRVASTFLQRGNVLLEKNAKGHVRPVAVRSDGTKVTLPMVVLANGGTASAAEIVAGALQDSRRAVVVGEKTFGTGTVLRRFALRDGSALMLAVEEWLTPNAHTIWHKGIQPDRKVALKPDVFPLFPQATKTMSAAQLKASHDTQLLKALSVLGVSL